MDLRPRRPSSRRSSTTDPRPASFPDLAATPPHRNPLAVVPFKSTPSAAANAHTRPSLPSLSTACSVGGNGSSKRDRRCCPLKSESSFVQLVLIYSNLPLLLPALPVPTTWSSSSGLFFNSGASRPTPQVELQRSITIRLEVSVSVQAGEERNLLRQPHQLPSLLYRQQAHGIDDAEEDENQDMPESYARARRGDCRVQPDHNDAPHKVLLPVGNGSLQQQRAVAQDMLKIYNDFIGSGERHRIERLELFDEFEEWHMMQEHYCVAYGINDDEGIFEDFGFKE